MPNNSDKKSLLTIIFVASFVLIGTTIISFIARGYQINFQKGPVLKATGLLSATSRPKSASVYIDNQLVTATDDTINLPPGSYSIKIAKDGYLPWEKTVQIKKEVVYLTNANLFRSVTELKPITLSGAINPSVSPDGNKIIYAVNDSSSSKDNGLYLLETYSSPIPINRSLPPKLLSSSTLLDWSKFKFEFSPNSRQVIATNSQTKISYLLPLDSPITPKNLFDISTQLASIKKEWQVQEDLIISSLLQRLPESIKPLVATDSAKNLSYSSSETKILYKSAVNTKLDKILVTPPLSQNDQPQTRNLQKNMYYVYDLKEDTNYLIGDSQAIFNPAWLPDSDNLIFVEDNKIKVVESDSTNKQTLFGGNFNSQIVVPWSDGTKIITLTSAYPGTNENLYLISIR